MGGEDPLIGSIKIVYNKHCTRHSIYPCKICTKLFETNSYMKEHIIQVDGNLSYSDNSSDVSLESFHIFRDSQSSLSFSDELSLNITDNIYEEDEKDQEIPVITNIHRNFSPNISCPPWYDIYLPSQESRIPVRKTMKRDNRLKKSILLPIIAVSNLRSLMPKVRNFAEDIHERNIGLGLLTEVWQKKDKKKHIFEVEKLMKM